MIRLTGKHDYLKGKSVSLLSPAPFAKIFAFALDPNQIHNSLRLVPKRAYASGWTISNLFALSVAY
jgi:hypothetical protein